MGKKRDIFYDRGDICGEKCDMFRESAKIHPQSIPQIPKIPPFFDILAF